MISCRTLLEKFSNIVFSFTRGVAGHYIPDEPEFTPELFGYNAFGRTGREWNFFPVDDMIDQEYSDRQDNFGLPSCEWFYSTIERRMFTK